MKTRSKFTTIPLAALISFACGGVSQATELMSWDITGSSGATGSGIATPAALGVSGSAMTGGGSTGNTTSPADTWNRTYTLQTTAVDAIAAGNFFSFSTTVDDGFTATFTGLADVTLRRTSSGPSNAELYFSTDGGATYTKTGNTLTLSDTNMTSAAAAFSAGMSVTPIVVEGPATLQWRVVVLGGTAANRIGFGKTATKDFTFLGSSTSAAVIKNLAWAGNDGDPWNTSTENWADLDNANVLTNFTDNSNTAISTTGGIVVDAAGVVAGGIVVNSPGGTTNLSGGTISGLSLTKSGAGTLVLQSPSSFAGSSTLSGGTLQIPGGASFATNGLNFSGGATLEIASTATFSSSGANTLSSGGATIANNADLTLANISNSILNNPFTKSGSGELTLSGIGTQITGPVDLDITAGSVVASGPVGSARQINVSGTNTINGNLTLNGPVLMLHGSTVSGTGSIIANGSTSSITSRLNAGAVNVNVPVTLNTAANVESPNGNNNFFLNAPITGAFGLTKKGNGVVVLTGANDYTTTTIEAGTLRLDTGGSLGSGDVAIATTLQFNQADAITVANTLSGAGVVRMTGGGSVSLTGTNTYSGVTTVSAGTLNAPDLTDGSVAGSIGAAPADAEFIVLNGGTLAHTGAETTSDRLFTIGILGGTLAANGSGPLNMAGTGDVAVSEPGETAVGGLVNGTRYKIVTAGDTDFTSIGAANSDPGTVFTATGPGTGTGTVVYANTRGFRLSGTVPGISVLAATISDAANAPTSLTKNGANTWSVTAANTYTGDTRINEGTLRINQPYLANSSAIIIGATAILDLNFDETGGDVTDSVNTLTIDGVQQPVGVYGADGSGAATINNTNFAGIGTLTVLTGPIAGDTYADWALDNGIGAAAFNDDFDNDGISNGVEYALGTNPTASSQPTGVLAANKITFTKGAEAITNADVSWIIEISETLAAESWTPVVTQAAGNTDPTIEYTFTPGSPAKEFARLKVVQVD